MRVVCTPELLTGDGRCSRFAANLSPGDSKATTGTPNVTPRSEPTAPPSLPYERPHRQHEHQILTQRVPNNPNIRCRVHIC